MYKNINVGRAFFIGVLLWIISFVIWKIVLYIPLLRDLEDWRWFVMYVFTIPIVFFGVHYYSNGKRIKNGFFLGLTMVLPVILLDLFIVAPLVQVFNIPDGLGGYNIFIFSAPAVIGYIWFVLVSSFLAHNNIHFLGKTIGVVKEDIFALERKALQLQDLAEFGRLTSGLFHDVVNPLTAISLNLENLKRNNKSSEIYVRADRALDNVKRITNILVAGRRQIQRQETNELFFPHEQIVMATQLFSHRALEKKISLEFVPPENRSPMCGDALKFYRVMTCFISNAIDSYDTVDVEPLRSRKIIVKFQKKDDHFIFTIQDFGCGISSENLPKIFDPLFTTKNIKQGTGLGLYIGKKIIEEDFGGQIVVTSKEGKGSIFAAKFSISEEAKAFIEQRANNKDWI